MAFDGAATMSALSDHVAKWKDCELCPLWEQRSRICLGRGTVPCDILFIGEAPGASEDATGQPFKGPAGDLLDKIIERALPGHVELGDDGATEHWVYDVTYALTNLVCCFPREAKTEGTNEPAHSEIAACRPRLVEFVNIARPKLIVCVGALAAEYVSHTDTVRCVDIVHPAAILRMPLAKKNMAVQRSIVVLRNAVEDMLQVGNVNFTKWGQGHANGKTQTDRASVRADYDASIPF